MTLSHQEIIAQTRHWVEKIVVGLNLCPFARRELVSQRLQFIVSDAITQEQLLLDLQRALLDISESKTIETSLLIHPEVLQEFYDYNQFLDYADALLCEMNLEGIYQIASFHPNYQFAGTAPEDTRNYSNKSPFPMLHILNEDSIEKAITDYPDSENIPQRNQDLLAELGIKGIKEQLE